MKSTNRNFLLVLFATAFAATCPDAAWAARRAKTPDAAEAARAAKLEKLDLKPFVQKAVDQGHPRIFANEQDFAALRARIKSDSDFARDAAFLREVADEIVPLPPLERIKIGKRLLSVSRQAEFRLLTLALSWKLFGDERHQVRARRELAALCAFEDWNPSHFLDVGEMSVAVGVGYDWLYDCLTPEERRTISSALLQKGIIPYLAVSGDWRNNWGQVCHCGSFIGAVAVADTFPDKTAACLHKLLLKLPLAMAAYAPAGNFPEGPGYWCYATEFAVFGLDAMRRNLGCNAGLANSPGFVDSAAYLDLVTGPSGMTFNYADGGSGRGSDVAPWYFAKYYGRKDVIRLNERNEWRAFLRQKPKSVAVRGKHRFFPLIYLWYQDEKDDTPPGMPLAWNPGGRVPVVIQRSGWGKEDFFVGLKGGTPSGPHGHMDGGSFVLDAKGVRWGYDLGAESYNEIEQRGMSLWKHHQESDRWKIYRLSTWSHNTLMIAGEQQCVTGSANIVSVGEAPLATAVLDLSTLYPSASSVQRRGQFSKDGKTYLLGDNLEGLKPGTPVRWAMTTRAAAKASGDVLTLELGGEKLRLEKRAEGSSDWEIAEDAPPNEWDSPNQGFRQVRFTTLANADGRVRLGVFFRR